MAYKYKGRDRRMMQKGKLVLQSILGRDTLALNVNKRTTKLSTRSLILDNIMGTDGMTKAATDLVNWFTARLAMTT